MGDYYVLWGSHPSYCDGIPVKVSGGTQRECCVEQRVRERQGWSCMEIKPSEVRRDHVPHQSATA